MFICGASAYPRIVDFAKFAEVCTEADCLFLADIALISGLVTRRCRRRRAGRLYLFLAESFVRELSKHFSRRIRIHMTHVTHNYCCCRWPHADLYNNVIYSKVIVFKDVIIFWSANVSLIHFHFTHHVHPRHDCACVTRRIIAQCVSTCSLIRFLRVLTSYFVETLRAHARCPHALQGRSAREAVEAPDTRRDGGFFDHGDRDSGGALLLEPHACLLSPP